MLQCSFLLAARQFLVKMTSALQRSECCSATSAAQLPENCSATSVFACAMLQGWGLEGWGLGLTEGILWTSLIFFCFLLSPETRYHRGQKRYMHERNFLKLINSGDKIQGPSLGTTKETEPPFWAPSGPEFLGACGGLKWLKVA